MLIDYLHITCTLLLYLFIVSNKIIILTNIACAMKLNNKLLKEQIFMSGHQKFYICKHCGNLVGFIDGKGAPMTCCGEKMSELVPNTVEASAEKHIPAVTVSGDSITVQVGSVMHPMEEAHHITFVYVETKHGGQRKALKVGDEPKVSFSFTGDKPVAVYAYCNLHGLWKTEVK